MSKMKINISCFLILQFLYITYGLPTELPPRDYTYIEQTNSWYKYKGRANWHYAVESCASEGGRLFYPENEAEAKQVDKVLEIFFKKIMYIWVGVSNLQSNDTFKTIDGRSINDVYHHWSGEPRSFGDYHCAVLDFSYDLTLGPCSGASYGYVCKYSANTSQDSSSVNKTTPQSPAEFYQSYSGATPQKWTGKDYIYIEVTKTYYKYHNRQQYWKDAVAKCLSEGATLFYAENQKEMDEIAKQFYYMGMWIGISDLRVKDYFETVDGRLKNDVYNHWFVGEPKSYFGTTVHCASVYPDRELRMWTVSCDTSAWFICKYKPREEDAVSGSTTAEVETSEITTENVKST